MTSAAFLAANKALNSIDDLMSGLTADTTPIILHHPPSRRPAQTSAINQNLAIFDLYEDELSKIFQKISQMKNRLLRQRAACASALTPIAALPIELMHEVFRLVADANDSSVAALAAVCSSWRLIALNRPTLWATMTLHVGDDLKRTKTHHLRSQSSPLYLHVNEDLFPWPEKLAGSLPDVDCRLETLHWDTSVGTTDLFGSHGRRFTALKTITISFPESCATCGAWWSDIEDGPIGLSFLEYGRFPALRNLEVERARVELPKKILGRLEHLSLYSAPMAISMYHKTIRYAHSLKSLVIHNVSETNFFDHQLTLSEESYVFPYLETVWLASNPPRVVELILHSCRCPSLLTLQLRDVTDSGVDPSTNPPLLSHFGSFVSHLECGSGFI
ncbi:hypothetical protein DL93DRAFT_371884 [Clavulina sp. PMI_390]|nr:hypothetical protein DL93DRAFT_371884 [Clavulina sp. PMI_390]